MIDILRKANALMRSRKEKEAIRQYFDSRPVRKLHIGASNRILDGWLNTDLMPSSGVLKLNATEPFPFSDNSFDYIFAEHIIEHIAYNEGRHMLAECHRTLRAGGVLRVVTPDLRNLSSLYTSECDSTYVDWFCKTFVPEDRPRTVGSVLNAHFNMWGHQFLYDETLLVDSMARTGFSNITRVEVGESSYAALRAIENESRYPAGLLRFESLACEAVK